MTLSIILLVAGAICLLLAAFNVNAGRVNLGWLGLFFWLLATLISGGAVILR